MFAKIRKAWENHSSSPRRGQSLRKRAMPLLRLAYGGFRKALLPIGKERVLTELLELGGDVPTLAFQILSLSFSGFGFCPGILFGQLYTLHKKGAGYQDPDRGDGHHQIMTHGLPQGFFRGSTPVRLTASWREIASNWSLHTASQVLNKPEMVLRRIHTSWIACWPPGRITIPLPTADWLLNKMRSITRILKEKPIVTKDDYRSPFLGNGSRTSRLESGCKPSEETLRQGRNRTKERKVFWNAKKCWHQHPYFSENLKYVR